MQNAECRNAGMQEKNGWRAFLTRAHNKYLVLPVPPLLKSTQIVSKIKIIKK
jgi:hypothetical protein